MKDVKGMLMNKKTGGGKLGSGAAMGKGMSGDNFAGKGSKGNCSYAPKGYKKNM